MNSFMVRLDTALSALRNFTGNASHQLRTPLAVIRTQLTLAQRAGDAQAARSAVAKGDAALADAERILAQLLLLARVDAAAGHPMVAPLDAHALARDLTGEMIPRAAGAGIDLGYDGQPVVVRAEPVLLAEALKNLIDNALAYAGRGAEVTVRVARQDGTAVISVEDDGPGIAAPAMDQLTSRFTRGASAEARPGGSGLGLSIVTEIAQLFGGTLRLRAGAQGRTAPAGGVTNASAPPTRPCIAPAASAISAPWTDSGNPWRASCAFWSWWPASCSLRCTGRRRLPRSNWGRSSCA